MDCATVNREELAEQYLQGKLDSARQDEFETHLLECARCLQELELLQAVRRDLAERGHEIRAWTVSKPFFRWETAVLAMVFLMLLAVGISQFKESKRGNESAKTPPKKQTDEARPPVEEVAKSEAPPQSITQSPARQAVQGKNVTVDGLDDTRDLSPTIGHAPRKGASGAIPKNMQQEPLTAEGSRSKENALPTQALPDSEGSSPRVASQETAGGTNPGINPGAPQPKPAMTTAQGVELARIGMVEAPAYTFSGLAFNEKPPRTDKRGAFSKDAGLKGPGRELFKEGMNKYVDGHYSEAAEYLKQAVQLEPQAVDINFYLGICDLLQGHPEESLAPLKNAAAVGQSIYLQPSHYYLAKAYVQGNKLANAEEEFRKATAAPGRLTSEAKALLARLQTLRGQIEKP